MFDEREQQLIANCVHYAQDNPAGLPGHNLMIIIAKLVNFQATPPGTYEIVEAEDGFRWHFQANNNEIIASGEAYDAEADAIAAVTLLKASGLSPIVVA